MKIGIHKGADVIVIEGDEGKLNEMRNIHGVANVTDLDAVVAEAELPAEPEPQQPPEPPVGAEAGLVPDPVVLPAGTPDVVAVEADPVPELTVPADAEAPEQKV